MEQILQKNRYRQLSLKISKVLGDLSCAENSPVLMDYISLAQALCGLHTPIFFGPVNMRHWPIN